MFLYVRKQFRPPFKVEHYVTTSHVRATTIPLSIVEITVHNGIMVDYSPTRESYPRKLLDLRLADLLDDSSTTLLSVGSFCERFGLSFDVEDKKKPEQPPKISVFPRKQRKIEII